MTDAEMQSEARPLITHLIEFRKRVLYVMATMLIATSICYLYAAHIFAFLVEPLARAMGPHDTQRLIYTGLAEAFLTYVKVAFFAGIFLTFPILLWQLWKFVAPGLYKNERSAFLPFMIATPALFFTGAACVFYLVLPMALPFFLSFQTTAAQTALPIQLETKISEYLDTVMVLIFAFGLAFQLPVLITLMGRAGIVTHESLVKTRKYAIVVIFIVAAILSPPDIFSCIALAIPLLALYEISILLVRNAGKPKQSA